MSKAESTWEIPRTIKIGWREYTVREGEDKRNSEGEFLMGEIDYDKHVIFLDNTLLPDEKKCAFLHEVVHGIFYSQVHTEWRKDEDLVSAIAEGLMNLTRDNPDLFRVQEDCSK